MFFDYSHNKLTKELITDSFKREAERSLFPLLQAKYSDSLLGIQLYEDYIADSFVTGERVYYPLTVVTHSGYTTEWISAPYSTSDFAHSAIFTYTGEGELDFALCSAPVGFEEKLVGRRRYFDGKSLEVNITSPVGAISLSGRYSQSFLDLIGERVTAEIERVMSVKGLADSGVYIEMPFAPETYMEHTSENVTFRRLLISDKTSSAKDFFIRWKRLDSKVGYTVSDTPDENNIEITLGEDAPQKIREREYRFLTRVSPNRYQTAMGRKNVTEWRELIKRAIKRGELQRVSNPEDEKLREVSDKLNEIFREIGQPLDNSPAVEITPPEYDEDFERALEALRKAAGEDAPSPKAEAYAVELEEEPELRNEESAESEEELEEIAPEEEFEEESEEELEEELEEEFEEESVEELEEESKEELEEESEEESVEELGEEPEQQLPGMPETAPVAEPVRVNNIDTDRLLRMEEELTRLRDQYEALLKENQRLELENKKSEEEKQIITERSRREEEKYKELRQAQMRAEERERERMKEAAIAEIQAKRAEEARLLREEEERRNLEELEAKRLEEERLERERLAEEARLRREYDKPETPTAPSEPVNYVSYTATLIFRHSVDPNSMSRIRDLIKTTISYYRKDDVKIHIKASMPDNLTVKLNFVSIPENEHDLVVSIIKVLGKSDLGISRAVLE